MTSTINSNSDNSNNNNNVQSLSSSLSIPLKRELTVYGFINQLIHKISHSHPHSIVTRTGFPLPIYSVIQLYYGLWGSYEAIGIGKNEWCQMGFGANSPDSLSKATPLPPALSALIANPSDIYVGYNRLLVKDINNHLHCAGYNSYGACAIDPNDDDEEEELKSFTRIHNNKENPNETVDDIQFVSSSLTAFHTILMTSNGNLFSFGANSNGQLCLGSKMALSDPRHKRIAQRVPKSTTQVFNGQIIIEITTGIEHSLFLIANGAVYGSGANYRSQIGFPKSQMQHSLIPIRVEFPPNENESAAVRITKI